MKSGGILVALIALGIGVSACGTTPASATQCSLAGFNTFYNYVPNPLPDGTGKTAALGPTILTMDDLTVTAENEGQFHEMAGPHCRLAIRWTPAGSTQTYRYRLSANGTLAALNSAAAMALETAAGGSPF